MEKFISNFEKSKCYSINDNLRTAIYRTNVDGEFIYVNKYFKEFFNINENEINNFNAEDIFKYNENRNNKVSEWIKVKENEEIFSFEKNGNIYYLKESFVTTIHDNDIFFDGFITDITDIIDKEEKSKLTEEKYKKIVEHTNQPILVIKDKKIIYVNNAAINESGYNKFEMLNKEFLSFIYEDEQNLLNSIYEKRMKGDIVPNTYHTKIKIKSNIIWAEVNVSKIDWFGENALIVYLTNINENKKLIRQLEESEEKYRTLVENLHDAIFIIEDYKFTFVNNAFANIFKTTVQEIIGKPFLDLVAPEHRDLISERNTKRHKGEKLPSDYDFLALDFEGNKIKLNLKIGVVHINNKAVSIGSILDVTEIRKLENEKLNLINSLEKNNLEKDKFFSIISHDLRAPLSGLIGYTKIMINNFSSLNLNDIKSISNDIYIASNNLYKLLQNLLEWSKIQRGVTKINVIELKINNTINSTLELFEINAKKKGIKFNFIKNEDITLKTDINLLNTILRNLISNAIKFSKKEDSITISSNITENLIKINVADEGIGMDKKTADKLFRIDKKVTSRGTDNELGSGLGLILCKEIAQKLGGDLDFTTEINVGTTFTLSLPKALT